MTKHTFWDTLFHKHDFQFLFYFQVFKAIKAENQGKVKVFFCGAPQLGRTVKEAAQRYGFAFCKENF